MWLKCFLLRQEAGAPLYLYVGGVLSAGTTQRETPRPEDLSSAFADAVQPTGGPRRRLAGCFISTSTFQLWRQKEAFAAAITMLLSE